MARAPGIDDAQQVRDVDCAIAIDVFGTTRAVDLIACRQAVPRAAGVGAGQLDGPEAGVADATCARWLAAVDVGIIATGSSTLPFRVDEVA